MAKNIGVSRTKIRFLTKKDNIKEIIKEYNRLKYGCSMSDWHRWTDKAYKLFKELEKGQKTLWGGKQ